MNSYLPGLTQTVVLLLKQKMQSDRDEARKTCTLSHYFIQID